MLNSENEEKIEEEVGEEASEDCKFKDQRVDWLKKKNLKLALVDCDFNLNVVSNVYKGSCSAGVTEKGQVSYI